MANKAQHAQAANATTEVQKTQAAQQVTQAKKVQEIAKSERVQMNKVHSTTRAEQVSERSPLEVAPEKPKGPESTTANAAPQETKAPGDPKTMDMLGNALGRVEQSQQKMDNIIRDCMNGKVKFDQKGLIGLQAMMYKYSMELDLTGKVVEKATSGLKDTLKTQV